MTIEQENEKHDLGLELHRCMASGDRQMSYQIYLYLLKEKYITEDEAVIVKAELDKRFDEENQGTTPVANKVMVNIMKKIGFSETKVLWRLIEQFPHRAFGDITNSEFIPNNESIIKQTGIPSVSYYELISKIIERDYMSKRIEKKRLIYRINFHKIMEDGQDE